MQIFKENFTKKPKSLAELMTNCQKISGKTIGDIATEVQIDVPINLKQKKGWLGELLEIYLGASAKNLPKPDFLELGVELKTLPLDKNNMPSESTYVCTAPVCNKEEWHSSRVKLKLSHVLWVPIQAEKSIPLKNRIIGTPFLWKPSKEQEKILADDWHELNSMLQMGEAEFLSAKYGKYLQIRPKAANSGVLIDYVDYQGNFIKIVPKGFYLRSSFTRDILGRHFN